MTIVIDGTTNSDGATAHDDGEALIKDTTTTAFMADVVEASRQVPVLVDFWAEWCGPCKQLQPVLEKTIRAAKGAVRLVKLNIDEHPAIPGQMGIKSIPAVLAFKGGQPVDGFMGAVPESQIVSFVERLIGGELSANAEVDSLLAQGEAMIEAKDYSSAAQVFAAILQEDKENTRAIAGLALCYMHAGDMERAEQTLALVPPEKAQDAAVVAAKAQIALQQQVDGLDDTAELVAALAANPADHQARFDLAVACNAAGQREQAVDHLIDIIKRQRDWNDKAAHEQLLQFFDAWGQTDEMTIAGRRKLSRVLFS